MDPFNDSQGGGVTYIRNLLKEQSLHYDVLFLGSGDTPLSKGSIDFVPITKSPGNFIVFNIKVIWWIWMNRPEYDIVHVHRSYFAIPFLHNRKAKIIVTLHSRTFDVVKERLGILSKLLIPVYRKIESYSLRRIHFIVPVSQVVKESFSRKYSWLSFAKIAPAMVEFSAAVSLREDRSDAIFVGRLEKIKRVKELCELWSKYSKNEILHLYGEGDEIPVNHGYRNVIRHGIVDHSSVMNAISKSRLLLVSSYSEAGPTVLREALFAGTPFLSTDVGEARLLAGQLEGCEVLDVLDKSFVITALEMLIRNVSIETRESYRQLAMKASPVNIFRIYNELY